jgi:fructose-specific phosphotransferase system IIC component
MADPITTADNLVVASISAATMALLGVSYYALIWALVGALLALYQAKGMGRVSAVLFMFLSTLVGAACGTAFVDWVAKDSRPLLILASLVCGSGAHVLVTALLQAGLKRINQLGGNS